MRVFSTKKEIKIYLEYYSKQNAKIGFVPTMGALHKGHFSLLENSIKNNDISVVSIFVNPTQFDKEEDLEKYPRTMKRDLKLLEDLKCNVVFTPNIDDIYDGGVVSQQFDFDGLENEMEGKFRKGHFDGVGTIVKKLFEIVQPTNAYFGEKDYQQLVIIKKMVEKNQMDVNVIGCPIYREKNGLALSSRNERLSKEQRENASIIYQTLSTVKKQIHKEPLSKVYHLVVDKFKKHPLFTLEYFSIVDENTLEEAQEISPDRNYRAFIAVFSGSVRLIDNIALNN